MPAQRPAYTWVLRGISAHSRCREVQHSATKCRCGLVLEQPQPAHARCTREARSNYLSRLVGARGIPLMGLTGLVSQITPSGCMSNASPTAQPLPTASATRGIAVRAWSSSSPDAPLLRPTRPRPKDRCQSRPSADRAEATGCVLPPPVGTRAGQLSVETVPLVVDPAGEGRQRPGAVQCLPMTMAPEELSTAR
jgi:hypothetical protein